MSSRLIHLIITSAIALAALVHTSCASPASAAKGGVKPYPLDVCIVSDNELGSMGDERRIVHEGQEIKFCCEPCVGKFLKNPAKFLAKIQPAK